MTPKEGATEKNELEVKSNIALRSISKRKDLDLDVGG